MMPRAGSVLGGRYALRERIAVGGMGEVWRGIDTEQDRPVAIKVLRDDLDPDGPFLARFRNEARTAGMLTHPGIAQMYDFREEAGGAYLVMELVYGEPLSAIIAREAPLGVRRSMDLMAQCARALHAAHEHGVVHRDVKPANILITPTGVVRITDFGIARPADHEPLTATGQVMGTAHYLAPEVARGQTASPASDVYALGVVAYECLAGRRPFEGVNQVEVATMHLHDQPPPLSARIPEPVRRVVAMAMSKAPAGRPQSALVLAEAFEALAEHPNHLPQVPTVAAGAAESPEATPDPVTSQDVPAPVVLGPGEEGAATGMPPTAHLPVQTRRPGGVPKRQTRDARAVVRGPRRAMRSPLVALIALITLILLGTLWSTVGRDRGLHPTPSTPMRAAQDVAAHSARTLPWVRAVRGASGTEPVVMIVDRRDKGWNR